MIGILFCVNLFWSVCLAIPVGLALSRTIGHLGMSEALGGEFAYIWWNDFIQANTGLLPFAKALMFGTAIFYLLINIFFTGGIIGLYRDGGGSWRAFFAHSGGFFLPLLRLACVSLVVFVFLIGTFYSLKRLVSYLLEDYPFGGLPLALNLLLGFFLLMSLLVSKMLFDYWRIGIIFRQRVSLRQGLGEALRFVARYPWCTFGLYGALLGIGCGLGGTYLLATALFSRSSLLGVSLILLIQQVFILSRIVLRLLFFSSQASLYRRLAIEAS